mmetsp:Transcript_40399/g.94920  ORF Transcript_40399/g.94920 Transcript_40399/m.94920 type:complete len:361 (-) Transcript_40399:545-1627(-)
MSRSVSDTPSQLSTLVDSFLESRSCSLGAAAFASAGFPAFVGGGSSSLTSSRPHTTISVTLVPSEPTKTSCIRTARSSSSSSSSSLLLASPSSLPLSSFASPSRPKTLLMGRVRSHTVTLPLEVTVTILLSRSEKVAGSTFLIRSFPAVFPVSTFGYKAMTPRTTPSSPSSTSPTASTARLPSSHPAAKILPPCTKHSALTLVPRSTSSVGTSPFSASNARTRLPAQYPHRLPSGLHRTSLASAFVPVIRCTCAAFPRVRSHSRTVPSLRPRPRAALRAAAPEGWHITASTGPTCPASGFVSAARYVPASRIQIFPSSVPRHRWVVRVDGGGGQAQAPAEGMAAEEGGRDSPISRRAGRE